MLLVPQAETFAKGGGQEDPPGFHVIRLPFVDDIRDPPRGMTDNIVANDDETKAMEKIIRRLRFKSGRYASDAYQNPALQYHQRQLEALAFEEDFDTALFEDVALPKYAGVHRQAGPLMAEWKRLIDEDDRAVEDVKQLKPARKRAAAAAPAKRDAAATPPPVEVSRASCRELTADRRGSRRESRERVQRGQAGQGELAPGSNQLTSRSRSPTSASTPGPTVSVRAERG